MNITESRKYRHFIEFGRMNAGRSDINRKNTISRRRSVVIAYSIGYPYLLNSLRAIKNPPQIQAGRENRQITVRNRLSHNLVGVPHRCLKIIFDYYTPVLPECQEVKPTIPDFSVFLVFRQGEKANIRTEKKFPPCANGNFLLEQMTGIEPAYPAWEAGVLPLNYICGWWKRGGSNP